ncbi:MAG: hypothetical protein GXP56_19580 [Deltaproteobacteria bacterium]|nr:hypothetical protein [Deltaproteobacteria bacterium]
MAIYTLEEIEQEISDWKAALNAVRHGKEYSMGARRLVRSDLPEIREHLEWLSSQKAGLENGSRVVVRQGRVAR